MDDTFDTVHLESLVAQTSHCKEHKRRWVISILAKAKRQDSSASKKSPGTDF